MKILEMDIGNRVVCDLCNTDFSSRDDTGGLLLQSKAVCPLCSVEVKKSCLKYGEMEFIKAYCPKEMSFRDWILSYRSDNIIRRIEFDSHEEMMDYLEKVRNTK